MKNLLVLFLLFIPLAAFCQTEEKQYYVYNIVSFEGSFTKEDFKVYYDNGVEVKKLRDDKGDQQVLIGFFVNLVQKKFDKEVQNAIVKQ